MEKPLTKVSYPGERVILGGDIYEYSEFSDGSKLLYTEKNSKGFKITLKISGDPEEHAKAHEALKNFFVKGCKW
ncbi:hypothetical protein GCM10008014_08970 [Paenibacillus silvae]|uniref:Uncharacterized protein n=1 Tax=Paenibacillus silvae TaxID=1325358 RepID=A0ABQ1Z211_9BACL|nr:hypothetical protein [Paenibacillus silvae]GGH46358.1 hypothetical protein GCM10008014_08970 [Paenibacillus silvae]